MNEEVAEKISNKVADQPHNLAVNTEAQTLRVSISKVDQLINLVGELVITQAMMAQNSQSLTPELHQKFLTGLADLERNTRDLQESVMSIRMIPMSVVFSRFPRMLRDLAIRLGKSVDFITRGESTELDKGLVEKIIDPLTHLVRNSCDHGIELPAERLRLGKPEKGTISLSAMHQGVTMGAACRAKKFWPRPVKMAWTCRTKCLMQRFGSSFSRRAFLPLRW